jgi:hypothetical protein
MHYHWTRNLYSRHHLCGPNPFPPTTGPVAPRGVGIGSVHRVVGVTVLRGKRACESGYHQAATGAGHTELQAAAKIFETSCDVEFCEDNSVI